MKKKQTRWQISAESFDANILDRFCDEIKTGLISESFILMCSVVPLPVRKGLVNINRSPFVYTTSKDQLAFQYHRRAIFINFDQLFIAKVLELLKKYSLPSSLNVKVITDMRSQNEIARSACIVKKIGTI